MQDYQHAGWLINGLGGVMKLMKDYFASGGSATDDQIKLLTEIRDQLIKMTDDVENAIGK